MVLNGRSPNCNARVNFLSRSLNVWYRVVRGAVDDIGEHAVERSAPPKSL